MFVEKEVGEPVVRYLISAISGHTELFSLRLLVPVT